MANFAYHVAEGELVRAETDDLSVRVDDVPTVAVIYDHGAYLSYDGHQYLVAVDTEHNGEKMRVVAGCECREHAMLVAEALARVHGCGVTLTYPVGGDE